MAARTATVDLWRKNVDRPDIELGESDEGELCYSIPDEDVVGLATRVEEDDSNLASITRIDETGRVEKRDSIPQSQSRTRHDQTRPTGGEA